MGAADGRGEAAAMRAAVRRLSFGAAEEQREAAAEVAALARSDERRKRLLPELGVVPPLVAMLAGARLAAVAALLELARGTHRNKVHIVKAGLLKKLPQLMDDKDLARSQQLALLVLSISSLANTDFPLSASELLPFLVATLSADDVPADTKLPCLAALRNLSTKLEHVRDVVSSGAVHALLSLVLDKTASEAALSILGELAATSAAGKKAMEEDEAAPRALLEAMTWHGSARCQEHATYLVMVLTHGSRALRRQMRQLGVVQALLEVSLLGSPLAQRRAAKVLQWFKEEGQSRIRAHSGPRMEGASCHDGGGGQDAKDCRDTVDKIVKQSLDRNMKSILRRATASVDLTNVKLLVASSSSKSLPC
ncbi:hypothetical protein GQ55_3G162600 [Panicum hallii var. hallii]|uniref:Armadillo repeat-containing domain-containing protein n=2 Tax=Panicum hallii TaxID=206008 RepID=A0A2T7EA23_9POAL|nr:hypothetical protein GQ55_3G162600 [Panicum hallii var. hallii]